MTESTCSINISPFDIIDINRTYRLNHSNGTVILQTISTYSHILHKQSMNANQRNLIQ